MSQPSKRKVYYGVLEELRAYIKEHSLFPGDKLPSERELAEKLDAGRSSVREALRALELLGLIETRHGEGTFLRTYQSLQSVELLSSFILFEKQTKEELFQAKSLLEKEATKLAMQQWNDSHMEQLHEVRQKENLPENHHSKFFNFIFQNANNELLLKIWTLMEEFSRSIGKTYYHQSFYDELERLLKHKDMLAVEVLFEQQYA